MFIKTLRDSGSEIYSTLKKAKIQEGMIRVIKYCLRDSYIRDIDIKRASVDEEVSSGRNVRRDWGEFKPPMMKYE